MAHESEPAPTSDDAGDAMRSPSRLRMVLRMGLWSCACVLGGVAVCGAGLMWQHWQATKVPIEVPAEERADSMEVSTADETEHVDDIAATNDEHTASDHVTHHADHDVAHHDDVSAEPTFDAAQDGKPMFVDPQDGEDVDGPTEPPWVEQIANADVRLMSGDHVGAKSIYDKVLSQHPEAPRLPLLYRRAVSLEMSPQSEDAMHDYRRIVDDGSDPSLAAIAMLGQSRIWGLSQRSDPSRNLLLTLALQSARRPRVLAHTLHLLTYVTASEAVPRPRDTFLGDHTILVSPYTPRESYLLSLLQAEPQAARELELAAGIHVQPHGGSSPLEAKVEVSVHGMPTLEVLQQIADACQMTLDIPATQLEALRTRSVTIESRELDVATLCDGLLEPLGLLWNCDDPYRTFHVVTADRVSQERRMAYRGQQAQRLGRLALALYPNSPQASMTSMCLGNVDFVEGRFADAINDYREVERRGDASDLLATAWFNSAKAHLLEGNRTGAREAFYRVVDGSRGEVLEAVAYMYLGKLLLEDGETDQATRLLTRSLSLMQNDPHRPHTVITLAMSYLLAGNPQAANMVLVENREGLEKNEYAPQVAFISALARFRASVSAHIRVRRGRDLTNGLAAVDPAKYFADAGYLLVGQAYEEIGLPNQLEVIFGAAVKKLPPHPMRHQMSYELAAYLNEERHWKEAEAILEPLLSNDDHAETTRKAHRLMAEMALAQNDTDRCLRMCYDLLNTAEETEEKEAALRIMGQAYELRHDHYQAAICFAGLVPVEQPADGRSLPGWEINLPGWVNSAHTTSSGSE